MGKGHESSRPAESRILLRGFLSGSGFGKAFFSFLIPFPGAMMNIFDQFKQDLYFNFVQDDRYLYLINGLKTTLIVTFFALVFSFVVGLVICLIRVAYVDFKPQKKTLGSVLFQVVNKIAELYVTVIRGTPTALQLLLMFNGLLASVDNLVLVCILTFGMNSSAYLSEIFRGGFLSVPRGEMEGGRSLGLSYLETTRHIRVPLALKNSLPAIGNECITLFKETSISGFVGLMDLTRGSDIILSTTFNSTLPYLAAALIYLLGVILMEKVFRLLEKKAAHEK